MTQELSEKAQSISGIFQQIDKTLTAYRTYEEGHPVLQEFEKKLLEKFLDYLGNKGDFSVEVKPYRYFYGEEVVYENTDKRENFSFKFHQDGVRSFSFIQGLTHEELRSFLAIMRTNFSAHEHADDDTITLLWKSGLKHISYMVVETFIHQGEETVDTEKAILEQAVPFLKDTAPESIKIEPAQSPEIRNLRPSDLKEIEAIPEVRFEYNYRIKESQSRAQKEILQDEDVIIKRIILLLLRMLLGIKDDKDFLSTAGVVQRIMESMVKARQYRLVTRILNKLEDLGDPLKNPDIRKASLIRNLLSGLGGTNLVEILKNDVKTLDDEEIKELGELCPKLSAGCTEGLFEIFRSEGKAQLRSALIPALAIHGKGKEDFFASELGWADPEFSSFLLDLLTQIGSDQAALMVKKAFRHEDAKVRSRVLEALYSKWPDHAKSVSVFGLKDKNQTLRIKSLNYLLSLKDATLGKSIADTIKETGFDDRERDEKVQFYIALAKLAGKKAFTFLQERLSSGVLDRSSKDIDRQICSIWGLRQLGTPEAKAVVEEKESKKFTPQPVKDACLQALRSWPKL